MNRDPLIMACTCDIGAQVRGKGFPARDLEGKLESGIGWTPTNLMITAFGPIADSPWGALDDLVLMPDPATETRVDFADGWGLVRASNTGAALTARFESSSEEGLETIMQEFRGQISLVDPELKLTF